MLDGMLAHINLEGAYAVANSLQNSVSLERTSAAPQPLTGKVYTHFNSKVSLLYSKCFDFDRVSHLLTAILQWSFLVFFGIFELGSVLCGAAIDSKMLIIGRAFAGFGAAGIINGTITIISSCVPFEKRPGK